MLGTEWASQDRAGSSQNSPVQPRSPYPREEAESQKSCDHQEGRTTKSACASNSEAGSGVHQSKQQRDALKGGPGVRVERWHLKDWADVWRGHSLPKSGKPGVPDVKLERWCKRPSGPVRSNTEEPLEIFQQGREWTASAFRLWRRPSIYKSPALYSLHRGE